MPANRGWRGCSGYYRHWLPFGFQTKYVDHETGLYNFGYRLYDPFNARFLNRDPAGEGGGANLYAYAGNDPVNSSDYLGLFAYQRYVGMRAFTVARMSLSVSSRSDGFRLGFNVEFAIDYRPVYEYFEGEYYDFAPESPQGVDLFAAPGEDVLRDTQIRAFGYNDPSLDRLSSDSALTNAGARLITDTLGWDPEAAMIGAEILRALASISPVLGEAVEVIDIMLDDGMSSVEKAMKISAIVAELGLQAAVAGTAVGTVAVIARRIYKNWDKLSAPVKRLQRLIKSRKNSNVGKADEVAGSKIPNSELKAPPTKRGNAPTGNDGHPVELHHRGQTPDSPLDEMTRTDHRGKGNFKRNHENTGQHPSEIDRKEWKKERDQYWKDEYDSGRFDGMGGGD